jgi:hypothetical protein
MLLIALPAALAQDSICATNAPEAYALIGHIRPRHSREIESSNWMVGAETMDRDFTVYAHWREYLGPLGVKKARIQSGWSKTEKQRGAYDWEWVDIITGDMVAQGVEPVVCLCYGNPTYQGGGGAGLGGDLPSSPEALDAWDRYVAAFVTRYGEHVDEWEVWNEPRGKVTNESYARFLIRTAEITRRIQPRAVIIGPSTVRIDLHQVDSILCYLQQVDMLHLVDQVAVHPYNENPDDSYPKIQQLRDLVSHYSDRIEVRQNENGAPSQSNSFGALHQYEWSERKQAKWALRRLMGDLGHDIPSSYFGICDMHYGRRINYKGLLATNQDKTFHHAKQAYYAVQHVTAVFDDSLARIPRYPFYFRPWQNNEKRISAFGYQARNGRQVVAIWRHTDPPDADTRLERLTLTLPAGNFVQPVWADMLSGEVRDIPSADWKEDPSKPGHYTFRDLPVYDSVILVADESVLPVAPASR